MVATPGDPRNGVPLRDARASGGGDVKIDIAYGGSCTGGKKADMDMYAERARGAPSTAGKRVADGVHLYIQFGSQDIRRYAEEKGYLEIFAKAGAELVDPSCGACIKAGPGVERLARPGDGQLAQPQLPRPQRARERCIWRARSSSPRARSPDKIVSPDAIG